jgi:hypothetical protein
LLRVEARSSQSKQEIQDLKTQLRAARQTRINQEQYESIITQVNKFPSRSETQAYATNQPTTRPMNQGQRLLLLTIY